MSGPRLIVASSLDLPVNPTGEVKVTQKFLTGIAEYARNWNGPLSVISTGTNHPNDKLDQIHVPHKDLPFILHHSPTSFEDALASVPAGPAVLLGSLDARQASLAPFGRTLGIPVVYVTEYSLQTRRQIIRAECRNPLRRWRRLLREPRTERTLLQAARQAAALQCNGTPTYEAYKSVCNNTLLFFDTRLTADKLAAPADVDSKIAHLFSGAPLRLAFSGRLIRMKGVDHLPKVAAELHRLKIPFQLDIFGSGTEEPSMRREVAQRNLSDHVHFRGTIDFASELVPYVSRNVDLFVCCHRQGDPSCTYLETLSCATPIVGYANEAFAGLLRHGGIGWTAPMDDPFALAARIRDLSLDRPSLAKAMHASRQFASLHTFEQTFRKRVDHLKACAAST